VGVKIRSQSVMEIAVDILAQYIDRRSAWAEEHYAAPTGRVELE
jgi:hypothetical protein